VCQLLGPPCTSYKHAVVEPNYRSVSSTFSVITALLMN